MKAVNAAGVTATGYTGKIHFTSIDPKAVLPADYTFTAPAGGLAQDTAVIVIAPAAKDPAKESLYTEGSPDYVYEVKIQTTAGADLAVIRRMRGNRRIAG